MPFWKKEKKQVEGDKSNGKSKEKINYKARLEHKQYLAQESPEPIYDLIDCGLKTVPPGIYSRCKIMRKNALLLQENELTSLSGGGDLKDLASSIRVLDLHSNLLDKLPEEIGLLKELQVLYLQCNRLKHLPETLGDLSKLQTLNVSQNCLKDLPSTLGNCVSLKNLNVSQNPKLKSLPKNLCMARALEDLKMDWESIQYPDTDITSKGTEAIMKFLCKECDIEYISPSEYTPPASENGIHTLIIDPHGSMVQGNLEKLEQQKKEKKEQMLALEKILLDNQEREKMIAEQKENNKRKLLESMAADEATRDENIKTLQSLKTREKEMLNKSLHDAERCTDALINELVAINNDRLSNPQQFLEEMEAERREMEERFTIKAGEAEKLRQQDVLRAMQNAMKEEMKREELRNQYEAGKQNIISSAMSSGLECDETINNILKTKGKQQAELIGNLLEDEKYQRSAFSALYMQQDDRTKDISAKMEQVQSELASLTRVEMAKRDMKVEFENELMSEKRETLTKMLVQLMDQKEERAQVLQTRLREMETRKETDQENYWLIQYQKLLDSKPKTMLQTEANVDSDIREVLMTAGAEEYLPIIAQRGLSLKEMTYMTDKELSEMGIHNTYLRQKIQMCIQEHSSMKEQLSSKIAEVEGKMDPSAPPDDVPSAPPLQNEEGKKTVSSAPPIDVFQSSECVICMENKCDILFLPCGHVCSCWKCESQLNQCPLCRVTVTQKVRLG